MTKQEKQNCREVNKEKWLGLIVWMNHMGEEYIWMNEWTDKHDGCLFVK